LNTYWIEGRVKERLTPYSMDFGHELYCLGHMTQAAISYYRATGDRRLLDAAIRYADYLAKNFGPEADKRPLLAGHPEIEMSLIELYRTTGDKRYLNLAGYILHGDSRIVRDPDRVIYTFSGIPFTDRTVLEGHAVRAMYASSGATDYYMETGDPQYLATLQRLWADLTTSKMYITGGLGSRWQDEAIGAAYELPNSRAYAETCAAIANSMWNWRMLTASGDARYADVFERALYNGVNVGMSLDGRLYCYYNPLEFDGKGEANRHTKSGNVRNPWYDVLCCPPNIQRTLGALPGYFYSTSKDGIYVHLFDNSVLDWHLEDGTGLKITQKTNFPWDGTIEFELDPARRDEFTFYLRIPGWTRSADVRVNGKKLKDAVRPGSYLPIRRKWRDGDKVRLDLDMEPRLMEANSRVEENVGRVAVQRGPLVYCLEQLDQPNIDSLSDITLTLGKKLATSFKSDYRADLLGGIVVLQHPAVESQESGRQEPLYHPVSMETRRPERKVELTFIPYYAWSNRQPSAMRVWIAYSQE
ncbi:MAG: glycoside hydrolase family 127 protein, partial [Deltaproteobacteria bacterium]